MIYEWRRGCRSLIHINHTSTYLTSFRAFKKKLGLGRFAPPTEDAVDKDEEFQEQAQNINVGDRCRVGYGTQFVKLGTVKFVGKVSFPIRFQSYF